MKEYIVKMTLPMEAASLSYDRKLTMPSIEEDRTATPWWDYKMARKFTNEWDAILASRAQYLNDTWRTYAKIEVLELTDELKAEMMVDYLRDGHLY